MTTETSDKATIMLEETSNGMTDASSTDSIYLLPCDTSLSCEKFKEDESCPQKQTSITKAISVKRKKEISCDFCKRCFTRESDMKRHRLIHNTARAFVCEICNKGFTRMHNLQQHLRTHSLKNKDSKKSPKPIPGERTFKCKFCSVVFGSLPVLRNHYLFHKDEMKHKCVICLKAFIDKVTLKRHCVKHLEGNEPSYKCKYCDLSFQTIPALRAHYSCHEDEKKFKCDVCSKGFINRLALDKHVQIHSEEGSFPCDVCDKSFKTQSYLTQHYRIHLFKRSFLCNVCNKCFIREVDLERHVLIHDKEEKVCVCDDCGRTFATPSHLEAHQRRSVSCAPLPDSVEAELKPFQCEDCKKRFTEQKNLKVHIYHCKKLKSNPPNVEEEMNTTDGSKPYQCGECLKSFSSKRNLTAHYAAIHAVEKPFKCELCDKSFPVKVYLKRHMRSHQVRDRPFLCPICNQSFMRKPDLERHSLTHTDVKPFCCDMCGKSFARVDRLNMHYATHSVFRNFPKE